ncbi:E1 ubiquitin-activating protein uba2 [Elasticomyces elasticus]|nr:E1 ubiquitin-activating protein uba2 [Elasticomyces elasticus]
MPRDRYLKQSLGSLYTKIRSARILVVGAGGIGCELLKNLVCTGFGEIHIVDLDTIDLSNLNRQFLFRNKDIKKSKALVAKETAGRFNPNVNIVAYHSNIRDPQFSISFFASFALVFNALDNLDARRHVNRMCLVAGVPLIESGTTGFNGQVQPILKGQTECYDCNPKEVPKSFPVCTIRSTPSQPIHCIVWAKSYLFTELFGISEDETSELDQSVDSENAQEIENLRTEAAALKKIRLSMGSADFPRLVFEKVFTTDIERLRSMEDMWKTRQPPDPLSFSELSTSAASVPADIASRDQKVWSLAENFDVFKRSLKTLSTRLDELKVAATDTDTPAILTFDKDDKDTLDFVASAANLRSHIFSIPRRSEFDIKQMAGNIIPAIATTNANTAALCVLLAFQLLPGNMQKAKMVFLAKGADRMITAETLRPPNPNCPVCSVAQARLVVDTPNVTLKRLVEEILRAKLGYGEEFSISTDAGVIFDPELDDNLSRTLSSLGIKDGSFVTVIDDDDMDPRVNLVLAVEERPAAGDVTALSLFPELLHIPRRPKAPIQTNGHADGAAKPVEMVDTVKRKRVASEAELEDEQRKKRGKVMEQPAGGDVIMVEDTGGGAIMIDDD